MIRNNVSQKMRFQHSVTDVFAILRVSSIPVPDRTRIFFLISSTLQRTMTTWWEREFFRMFLLLHLVLAHIYGLHLPAQTFLQPLK